MADTGYCAIAVAIVLVMTSPAHSACLQEDARYAEEQAGAKLVFAGDLGPADGMLQRFTITFAENGVVLDGIVMQAGEPDRPWGIIMHKCPEGDVTGDELAACTVWEGPVYGIDKEGNPFYLAAAGLGEEAAQTLLFPDFSAAVRLSSAWGAAGLSTAPKDSFRSEGCGQ